MAQTVQLKRSAVAGKVPTTGDLALGELALNTYDGRIFFKKDPGTPSVVTVVTTDDTQTLANKTLSSVTLIGSVTADGGTGAAGQVLTSNGSAVYWSTVSGGGGGGATNLSTTTGATTVTIVSDTGTDAVIPGANSTIAGVVTVNDQTFAGIKTFTSTIAGSINGNAATATALQTARTINGVSFDGTANVTITASTTSALTIGTGLSGTSFNGSAGVTIAIDSTVATLSGSQTLSNKTISSPVFTGTLTANGSVGTAGQVLTSNGSGLYWSTPSTGGGGVSVSDTAPGSPTQGDLWFNSTDASLSLYYTDTDSSQWIEVGGSQGPTGPDANISKALAMTFLFN